MSWLVSSSCFSRSASALLDTDSAVPCSTEVYTDRCTNFTPVFSAAAEVTRDVRADTAGCREAALWATAATAAALAAGTPRSTAAEYAADDFDAAFAAETELMVAASAVLTESALNSMMSVVCPAAVACRTA